MPSQILASENSAFSFLPSLSTVYKHLETPTHYLLGQKIVIWRYEDLTTWRKIVTGTALLVIGIAGLIETIARVALLLIFSPVTISLECAGYTFFTLQLKGTFSSFLSAGKCLTVFQFQNITHGAKKQNEIFIVNESDDEAKT